MLVRIEPNLSDTEKLVETILMEVLVGNRCAFLVPAGGAFHVTARIRTMISRNRKKMLAKGRQPLRFTLMSTVHPETHEGVRFDCIIMWKHVTIVHEMASELEDMLAHG